MTLAELHSWAVERNWGAKKLDELRQRLRGYVILHSDDETVERYADVRNVPGFPVNVGDAWVAATALRHGVPLVTHNRRHFEGIPGMGVLSEA
jgi:tRNA(fMet)-specific endonuclease VapC